MSKELGGQAGCLCCGGPLSDFYPAVADPQTGEAFRLERCASCDFVQTAPQPADLGPYYGDLYHDGRHGVTEAYCMMRRFAYVCAVAKGRTLLDFGCGDGGFLAHAAAKGWEVAGVEMKPDTARARGLTVHEDLDAVSGTFDVITLWHSLEHLKDPRQTLERVSRHLSPGGVILIAVPNRAGLQGRLFGSGWFHLDPPRHLGHFSPAALTGLLERTRLTVVRRWNSELEIDLFGWTQSLLNRMIRVPNVLFDILTRRGRRHSLQDVAVSLAAGSVISAACLPVALVSAALGEGGVMIFAARRQT